MFTITVLKSNSAREELRFGGLHLRTTASCAMLFRDVTAMLMNPVMGHSLHELKVENIVGELGERTLSGVVAIFQFGGLRGAGSFAAVQ